MNLMYAVVFRLDTVQHQRKIMQEELKKSTKKTLTAEEQAHQVDRMLADEEEKVKALEKELGLQREKMVSKSSEEKDDSLFMMQFKKEQELFEVKKKETNTQAGIQVLLNLCVYRELSQNNCIQGRDGSC